MAFAEPEIPKPPPELRPERLLEYDPREWADPRYVNQVYAWAHRVATKEIEPDAEVRVDGPHRLILLQAPMRTRNLATGKEVRMMACLLHEEDGIWTGWQIDNHTEALEVYDLLLHPEKVEGREIPEEEFYADDEDDDGV
jgi:hypothetical protein